MPNEFKPVLSDDPLAVLLLVILNKSGGRIVVSDEDVTSFVNEISEKPLGEPNIRITFSNGNTVLEINRITQ